MTHPEEGSNKADFDLLVSLSAVPYYEASSARGSFDEIFMSSTVRVREESKKMPIM